MNEFDYIKNPEELLIYMDKNITYGFLGKNGKKYLDANSDNWYEECLVQCGKEVIKSGIGTCYDQTELERLWFEKNNYIFKTIFAWFEVGRENDFPTHAFLIYKNNNKWYWFEHAFFDLEGIHEFNAEKEAINYFKEKHFEYAKSNCRDLLDSDKDKLVLYEYSKLKNSVGVQEYFNHVTKRHYIN